MAANHGEAKTSNIDSRSSSGASVGCSAKYACTSTGLSVRCGRNEPGTLASASRNSSSSAVRMLTSCRQARRTGATTEPRGVGGGAVDRRVASSAGASPCASVVSVTQTAVSKPDTQPRRSAMKDPHRPLTSSSPTTTSSPPPTRITTA